MSLCALLASAACALAFLFDQTHKLFVPGREFDAGDLLFDLLGYAASAALVFLAYGVMKRVSAVR